MRFPSLGRLPLLVVILLNLASARAEIIYDNSDTGGTDVHYSLFEFGDEVVFAGTSRVVTEFLFEYYGDFTPGGDEMARIRLYKNDGPLTAAGDLTPGTLLLDSGNFPITSGWQTKKFVGLNIAAPGGVTWTIQFSGLTGVDDNRAGLVLRPTPSVGDSYDDFWIKNNGVWQLFSWNGSPVANFAARIISGAAPTTVSVRRDASRIVVEWTGLSILQVADTVNGPYTDNVSARNRYEMNHATASMKFWRLRD
jgi:PKD repeat protein